MLTTPLSRVLLDVGQMARVIQDVAPDVTPRRVRGWQERGVLRIAGRVPAVHYKGIEALRLLVFLRLVEAFGPDSFLTTTIATEVSEETLQMLAMNEHPAPSITVEVGRFNYTVELDRGALDRVLAKLDTLPT